MPITNIMQTFVGRDNQSLGTNARNKSGRNGPVARARSINRASTPLEQPRLIGADTNTKDGVKTVKKVYSA